MRSCPWRLFCCGAASCCCARGRRLCRVVGNDAAIRWRSWERGGFNIAKRLAPELDQAVCKMFCKVVFGSRREQLFGVVMRIFEGARLNLLSVLSGKA